jgi:hypothetical protein
MELLLHEGVRGLLKLFRSEKLQVEEAFIELLVLEASLTALLGASLVINKDEFEVASLGLRKRYRMRVVETVKGRILEHSPQAA